MMHRCSNMVGPCTCGLFHTHHSNNSFSMLFSSSSSSDDDHYYPCPSSSLQVDCTLSLGTPSTRVDDRSRHAFSWQAKNSPRSDLPRRCANCDTTSTPLWRNGPKGPKSLCNACGIRFKKEERRASAAVANGGGMMMEQQQQHHHVYNNNTSWAHQSQKMPCYSPAGSEFRFVEDVDGGRDSFLSWRLNVTDRHGLVHDFTR